MSHNRHHHNRHKKKHPVRNTIIFVICFVLILGSSCLVAVNLVLNKMNYDDPTVTLQANPEFDEGITLPDEYKEADNAAKNNANTSEIYTDKNVINILLIGADAGEGSKYYPRSDAMMILSLNKNDNTIRLASLSRAVYVSIDGHNNGRLNAAHAYGGPNLLVNTIEKNYKIHIDNYVSVDFEAFKEIVEIFGGIDIYLTKYEANALQKSVDYLGVKTSFEYYGEGNYHLDGESTLLYARLRKIDSDRERTGRQRKILEKIAEKAKTMSLSQGVSVLEKILPQITTDMKKSEIMSQATNMLKYIRWNIEQTVIPDKSSGLILIDDVEVLLVDWNETIEYAKSFLYPDTVKTTKAQQ